MSVFDVNKLLGGVFDPKEPKVQEIKQAAENYTMKSFIICTLHLILLI